MTPARRSRLRCAIDRENAVSGTICVAGRDDIGVAIDQISVGIDLGGRNAFFVPEIQARGGDGSI